MRQVINQWTSLLAIFFAATIKEVSNFFETNGSGSNKNFSREPLHKIPRIGR